MTRFFQWLDRLLCPTTTTIHIKDQVKFKINGKTVYQGPRAGMPELYRKLYADLQRDLRQAQQETENEFKKEN